MSLAEKESLEMQLKILYVYTNLYICIYMYRYVGIYLLTCNIYDRVLFFYCLNSFQRNNIAKTCM